MGIDSQVVVTMSNFVGYMIEEAVLQQRQRCPLQRQMRDQRFHARIGDMAVGMEDPGCWCRGTTASASYVSRWASTRRWWSP
jgi:hypothetical protein